MHKTRSHAVVKPQAKGAAPSASGEAAADGADTLLYLLRNNCGDTRSETPAYIARQAFALNENVRWLADRYGLESLGFVTLTFRENLLDASVAQERFHAWAIDWLRDHSRQWVCALERQKRGAVHFHVLGEFGADIRTGLCFSEIEQVAGERRAGRPFKHLYRTANAELKALWRSLAASAKKHGFGRTELLPVKSTSEAISRYVGGYVAKSFSARTMADKGVRRLNYSRSKRIDGVRADSPWPFSSRFQWVTPNSALWRRGVRIFFTTCNLTWETREMIGKRWAWYWSDVIKWLATLEDWQVERLQAKSKGHPPERVAQSLAKLFSQVRPSDC